jgi:hypothetical protein
MIIKFKYSIFRFAALLFFCLISNMVLAQVKLADATFPLTTVLASQNLLMNGHGMRFRFGFKVYAAGLYTSKKVSGNDEIIKANVIKRLHLIPQRDLKGDELGKLFTRAMQENMSKDEFSKIINGVIRFGEMFAGARNFSKGDDIVIDVVPGTGLLVTFRGKQQGEAIKEPEFAENLFKIWFGKKPVDEQLRRALLGEQTTANTNIY